MAVETWCDACILTDGCVSYMLAPPSFGTKIAPEVVEAMTTLARRGIRLCRICKGLIQAGREHQLRDSIGPAIAAAHPDHTVQAALLAHAETAITLASWTFRPFKHPLVSPGFKLFNALALAFPRVTLASGQPGSMLERDLGAGVVGTFTIFQGILIFENLVSHERGRGNAARALAAVCAIADREGCAMAGYVQSNASLGLAPGLDAETLHAWYARYGFIRGSIDTNNVMRPPQPPPVDFGLAGLPPEQRAQIEPLLERMARGALGPEDWKTLAKLAHE